MYQLLGTVLKDKNNINSFMNSLSIYQSKKGNISLETIYEILCSIKDRKETLVQILTRIETGKLGFDSELYDENREQIDFQYNTDANSEVVDGILTCYKCGNQKIVSYTVQTRSMDEGFTLFASCIRCGNKWRQS